MNQTAGSEDPTELYPDVAAVAAVYGDAQGKYVEWLKEKSQSGFVSDASFLWDQPLGDAGYAAQLAQNASSATGSGTSGGSSKSGTNASGSNSTNAQTSGVDVKGEWRTWRVWGMLYAACGVVMAVSFLEFL